VKRLKEIRGKYDIILENGIILKEVPIAKIIGEMESLRRRIRLELNMTNDKILKDLFKLCKKYKL